MNEIVHDNGYKSRKLWFSVFTVVCIFAGALLAARWPVIAPLYETLVGGVVAVAALFLTGNVANKWVGTKVVRSEPPADE